MATQADKTDKVDEKTKAEERPAVPARSNYLSTGPAGRGWLYGLGAVVILVIVFAAGVGVANHRQSMVVRTGSFSGTAGGGFGFGRRGSGAGGFGGGTSPSGQTRVNGVVTAVSGSDFTIAGNGTTTNVTTDSSTQYQNGSTVKQNDSVLIFGTQSNGTIAASQIIVNPGRGGSL